MTCAHWVLARSSAKQGTQDWYFRGLNQWNKTLFRNLLIALLYSIKIKKRWGQHTSNFSCLHPVTLKVQRVLWSQPCYYMSSFFSSYTIYKTAARGNPIVDESTDPAMMIVPSFEASGNDKNPHNGLLGNNITIGVSFY